MNIPAIWQKQLRFLVIVLAVILIAFASDVGDIMGIWWNSSTFGHCLLILPIVGWLTWQQRDVLAGIAPTVWTMGLIPVGMGAVTWVLGEASGVALFRHGGLVLMLQGTIIAVLGRTVARALAFPIFYMIFMVPFGEELVPVLQHITAQLSMLLLRVSAIPAQMDGVFITTPTGYFEVAEACAGVNFLIAMVALGSLAAHLCFIHWSRRIAFLVLCIIMSIIANGVRAWGTIVLAHFWGVEFAVGFDHIFYGWIFFALVIALVLAIAWRFFEFNNAVKCAEESGADARISTTQWRVAAGVLTLALSPILWSTLMAQNDQAHMKNPIALPEIAGWQRIDIAHSYPWQAHFKDADHKVHGQYRHASGAKVDLVIILFSRQDEGREIVGHGQGVIGPDSKWVWTSDLAAPENALGQRITAPGPVVREAMSFYRIGTIVTGKATEVKWETLKNRLLGRPGHAGAIIISAEEIVPGSARSAINALLRDLGPVDMLMDDIAARAKGG